MARSTIDDKIHRRNWSKRAEKGRIGVVKLECPRCHHHKAFETPRGRRCTKCKWWIDE